MSIAVCQITILVYMIFRMLWMYYKVNSIKHRVHVLLFWSEQDRFQNFLEICDLHISMYIYFYVRGSSFDWNNSLYGPVICPYKMYSIEFLWNRIIHVRNCWTWELLIVSVVYFLNISIRYTIAAKMVQPLPGNFLSCSITMMLLFWSSACLLLQHFFSRLQNKTWTFSFL